MPYHRCMPELVFEVVQEGDGGYCAECLTENIFTEGDTWQQLRKKVLEATSAYFFDRPRPSRRSPCGWQPGGSPRYHSLG